MVSTYVFFMAGNPPRTIVVPSTFIALWPCRTCFKFPKFLRYIKQFLMFEMVIDSWIHQLCKHLHWSMLRRNLIFLTNFWIMSHVISTFSYSKTCHHLKRDSHCAESNIVHRSHRFQSLSHLLKKSYQLRMDDFDKTQNPFSYQNLELPQSPQL